MAILTAIIPSIIEYTVKPVIEYTVKPVSRQVGYIIHYRSNLENLRSQLKKLNLAKERREHTVKEDERKGKRIHTDIQDWQKVADEMIEEANTIFEKEGRANTKCFRGVCPNLISNHQLSRKSAKLARKIELHHDQKELPIVSYNAPLEEICATPSQNYMAFESRISMVKEIMEEFKKPDSNLIGVYGLGGVGKSTLVKEVYRQATKEELFDDVVIVLDAKQFPELERNEKIQQKIAEKLGMEVQGSMDVRIWNRIKDKKSLIILDDVWEAIDLEVLGLRPMATCKILLTSRNRVSEMRTQKDFPLDVLGEKESWVLFEKMVGDVVKDGPIKNVATQVAQKCGGLPVLVVTVASALRLNSSLEVWKDTLRRFKRFDDKELTEKARLAIEWSYNQLDAKELKPLFLLCGIIAGVRCSIFLSDLLKYAMGLNLVKNVDTVEDARNALHSLAKKLKYSCLLLDSYDDGRVRMHELVRDVAIWIAYKDEHTFSRAYGDEVKEWPYRDFLTKCSAISLKSCKIPGLPEVPWVCPKLRFFHLENQNIDDSLEIPGNYFEGMKELEVLDVTSLRIPSLPPSLQSLTNLRTLCLDLCVLGDIALVGQLTNLKILSLLKSKVKELPKEIGQLTRLQLLDLTRCSELVRIPPGVISSLTSLEDLRMGSFKEWERGLIDGTSNASVSELKQLRQLTALEIHIPDAKLLPANMFLDKRLERYKILIGDCWQYSRIEENMLKLKIITISQFGQGIKLLLGRCEHLYLDGVEAANIISYILASDSGQQLKNLHVQNNDEVTSLINSSHAFPILESLSLHNLVNLETVCCGQLIAQPFRKLRSLTLRNLPNLIGFSSKGSRPVVTTEAEEIISENEIGGPTKLFMNGEVLMPNLTRLILHQCNGLRFLFSCSMARSLVQLTRLEIASCQIMEGIVTEIGSSGENTDNLFCNLKCLVLQHLPSLTRFCCGSYIEFSLLAILRIEDCPRLGTFVFDGKSEITTIMGKENDDRNSKENLETVIPHFLFDEKVGFPSLESLIIYDLPALMTIWHNQVAPNSFCKLRKVEVLRCDSLINIFAPSMMGRLNALYTLEIWQCQSLQVVFELGGVFEAYDTQLKTFDCPNLALVKIDGCERLINIFPASVAKSLEQLTKLRVENCGLVEIVVKEEVSEATPKFVFPKVIVVKFKNLPQLRMFYPGMHVSEWPLLKQLVMTGCDNVEIFASEISRFQKKLELGLQCTPIKHPFFLVDKVLMPNLTSLVVRACGGFRFLFSSSMTRSLVQLKNLTISRCQIMEEIVTTNESSEEDADHNMLSQLQDLKLQYLPNLTRFCSARRSINLHSLEILHLQDCSKLETFIFDPMSTNITTNQANEEIGTNGQYFLFDEKGGFPSLQRLIIRELPVLRTIWHDRLAPNSFRKLKIVEVLRCYSLINIFAPSMMGRLNALHSLVIKQCKSLQVIFDVGVVLGVKEAYGTSMTQLKTFGCPNLDLVIMDSCESLKNIFPASVAKALQQLRELNVWKCVILEEIVANDGVETTPEFVFPKVTSMIFQYLPQLRSFYPELHVSKWPLLKSLRFFECGKVEIFASEYSRFQKRLDSGLVCTPSKQPFLLVDEGHSFPNLKELSLDENMKIWYEARGPLPVELFINLKLFRFSCAHPNSFAFLEKLHGLEQLIVYGGPWKEIFVYEGTSSGETHAVGRTLPHVKNLCLRKMEELMHLGNNDKAQPVFPNLEILKVRDCVRLKNLISSAISFRNLTTLNVKHCEGLKYLTTYSVAKCLHQLKWLEVEDCKSLIEMVASKGDEEVSGNYYEIVFCSLQHLKLSDLPVLQGFCSSEICTIRVPSLNSLIVEKCMIEFTISLDKSLIQSSSRPERLQITEEVEEEKEKEEEDDGNETASCHSY